MRRAGIYEQIFLLLLCGLAAIDVLLGYSLPPQSGSGEWASLARILLSTGTALLLVLGPGLALGRLRRRALPLTFVALPGLVLMAAAGSVSWALSTSVGAHQVSAVTTVLCIGAVAFAALTRRSATLDSADTRVMLIMLALVAVAVSKSFYSVGATGELFAGTISRTLEVGDRSDSRISFHVVELVDHGTHPYSDVGVQNFVPYSFSSRGPLAGLAAASAVEVSGARIPTGAFAESPLPNIDPQGPAQPWQPFDPQGFEAYRIAMIVMAACVVLGAAGVMRAVRCPRAAVAAAAMVATTPFVVHDTYFTWPKLITVAVVLAAAHLVLRKQRILAGTALGIAYLIHPLALLSLPALVLLAIVMDWRSVPGARLMVIGRDVLTVAIGPAAALLAWRIVNGSHYSQTEFFSYIGSANQYSVVTVPNWIRGRLSSTANTLVPLNLYFTDASDPSINSVVGLSPSIVHFYFQYWTTFPFGVGVFFFPLLCAEIVRAARRAPWLVVAVAVVPFVVFDIYWGSYISGLLREGLHVWVVTLLLLYVWMRFSPQGPAWQRSRILDLLLVGRSVEVLLMLILPAIATAHALSTPGHNVTDGVALAIMVMGTGALCVGCVLAHRLPSGQAPPEPPPSSRVRVALGTGL